MGIDPYCPPELISEVGSDNLAEVLNAPREKAILWHAQLYAELRGGKIFRANTIESRQPAEAYWEAAWKDTESDGDES